MLRRLLSLQVHKVFCCALVAGAFTEYASTINQKTGETAGEFYDRCWNRFEKDVISYIGEKN